MYYDNYPRTSLVDHLFSQDTTLENFAKCHYEEQGDFVKGNYSYEISKSRTGHGVSMTCCGSIRQGDKRVPLKIEKYIGFAKENPCVIEIKYQISNLHHESIRTVFGVEFNLAMLAGNAPDRFYYDATGVNLGPLITQGKLSQQNRFGIRDLWQKMDIGFELVIPAEVWFFPVQTVSQSEAGFELIYQSSAILLHWPLDLAPNKSWQVKILKYIKVL